MTVRLTPLSDSVACGKAGEHGARDSAPGPSIHVLDTGADTELGPTQVREVASIVAMRDLGLERRGDAVVEVEAGDFGNLLIAQRFCHAVEAGRKILQLGQRYEPKWRTERVVIPSPALDRISLQHRVDTHFR